MVGDVFHSADFGRLCTLAESRGLRVGLHVSMDGPPLRSGTEDDPRPYRLLQRITVRRGTLKPMIDCYFGPSESLAAVARRARLALENRT